MGNCLTGKSKQNKLAEQKRVRENEKKARSQKYIVHSNPLAADDASGSCTDARGGVSRGSISSGSTLTAQKEKKAAANTNNITSVCVNNTNASVNASVNTSVNTSTKPVQHNPVLSRQAAPVAPTQALTPQKRSSILEELQGKGPSSASAAISRPPPPAPPANTGKGPLTFSKANPSGAAAPPRPPRRSNLFQEEEAKMLQERAEVETRRAQEEAAKRARERAEVETRRAQEEAAKRARERAEAETRRAQEEAAKRALERAEVETRRAQEEAAKRARERAEAETMRAQEEASKRARERAAAEERLRLEEEKATEDEINCLQGELIYEIDLFIRTRRLFSSTSPLKYKCAVASILQSDDVKSTLELLNGYCDPGYTLLEFMSEFPDRFAFSLGGDLVGVNCVTPFQGANSHRVYGYFQCGDCHRCWTSASTWKNKWQKCQHCDSKCYPFQQHHLLRSNHDDENATTTRRPHDMKRCQKCQELGEICVPHMYYSMYSDDSSDE